MDKFLENQFLKGKKKKKKNLSGSLTIKEMGSVTKNLPTKKPDGFIKELHVLQSYRLSFRKKVKCRLPT